MSIEYSSWSCKPILYFQSPLFLAPVMWESYVGYPWFHVGHRLLTINISWGCSPEARCFIQDHFHHFFFFISRSTTHTKTPNPAGFFSRLEGKVSSSSLIWYISFKGTFLTWFFSSNTSNTKLPFGGTQKPETGNFSLSNHILWWWTHCFVWDMKVEIIARKKFCQEYCTPPSCICTSCALLSH